MGLDSIGATQFCRGDGGQHLALNAAERGYAHHDRSIEPHAGAHSRGVDAHDVHDVPHSPCAPDGRLKLPLEYAGGLGDGDLFDPGHGSMIMHV